MTLYNTIGSTYDATRCAEPEIVQTLIQYLQTRHSDNILDLACGSGNYTCALADRGLNMTGVDISEVMLAKARDKSTKVQWLQSDACKLPFEDGSFDGISCIWATHHFPDLKAPFAEAYRILKDGPFLHLTATTEQISKYWLNHYFPEMLASAARRQRSRSFVFEQLEAAGFNQVTEHKFHVTNDFVDMSLQAGKYRPEIYLKEEYRNCMSAFRIDCPKDELLVGLDKLSTDIDTGKIHEIIESYESDEGDFSLVIAGK